MPPPISPAHAVGWDIGTHHQLSPKVNDSLGGVQVVTMGVLNRELRKSEIVRTSNLSESNPKQKQRFYSYFRPRPRFKFKFKFISGCTMDHAMILMVCLTLSMLGWYCS